MTSQSSVVSNQHTTFIAGVFTDKEKASRHLKGGAKKVRLFRQFELLVPTAAQRNALKQCSIRIFESKTTHVIF